MNPAVDAQLIADAYAADEAAAAAEYGAEFRKDIESFVSREAVEAVVVPGRHELPPSAGTPYVAFVDPSGGSQDSMTLAIAHQSVDRTVLDCVRERRRRSVRPRWSQSSPGCCAPITSAASLGTAQFYSMSLSPPGPSGRDAAAEEPTAYLALFFTLARTGLRPGEAYALQTEDIDFGARKIRIERALSAGAIESTKTGESRTVDMSQRLADFLRDFLVWREKEKLRRGWAEMPSPLFFNEQGSWLDESRVRKHFAHVLKAADLPGFRVYDLRHSFATLLLSRGVPITYVSAQLGHAKPTTTLQWYSHWLPASDSNRFVDGLDESPQTLWHQFGTKGVFDRDRQQRGKKKAPVSRGFLSGPREIRTPDPLIKSQLL